MSSRDEKYEKFREIQRAYIKRFGGWPINGFPQFETYEDLFAAVEQAFETGVEIMPEYQPGIQY